jgi:hypothetical protein
VRGFDAVAAFAITFAAFGSDAILGKGELLCRDGCGRIAVAVELVDDRDLIPSPRFL